jgi:hypothetical protein
VEAQKAKLEISWNKYRSENEHSNALFRAVIHAFRREYGIAMFWNLFGALLQISSPFILHRLIEFIKQQKDDTAGGIMLVVTLVGTQGASYLIGEHLKFY